MTRQQLLIMDAEKADPGNIIDFYVGLFKRNDFLVAQDTLYKERIPYRKTYAKYGRTFACPITYLRVVDRLGVGAGPIVQIVRGGLQKTYVVLRILSSYNLPISVNIYIGCANNMPKKIRSKESVTTASTTLSTAAVSNDAGKIDANTQESVPASNPGGETDAAKDDVTTVAGE